MTGPRSAACDVTGRGVVSSLGQSVATFGRALLEGRSAIGELGELGAGLRFGRGAPIRDFVARDHFDERTLGQIDRFTQFAVVAARQAWHEAGLDAGAIDPTRVGVVIGTANGGVDVLQDGFRRLYANGASPKPLTIPQSMASAPASRIAREIGARGPVFGVSSACASAAHAIIVGAGFLRAGLVDAMVVGGTDSCFGEGYMRAWDALRVVSPDTCRPFSVDRRGLILGEGAGILVLERHGRAAARGARVIAEHLGGGMSCDAGDLLAPDPAGMVAAMRNALADAGVEASRVDYVNAHGTGTGANDRAEATALGTVFGGRRVPVSSIKSMIGHAMGAAGALEAIATLTAIETATIPPTIGITAIDPELDIDPVPDVARPCAIDVAMSNSFAFGGLDVSLIFGRAGA